MNVRRYAVIQIAYMVKEASSRQEVAENFDAAMDALEAELVERRVELVGMDLWTDQSSSITDADDEFSETN